MSEIPAKKKEDFNVGERWIEVAENGSFESKKTEVLEGAKKRVDDVAVSGSRKMDLVKKSGGSEENSKDALVAHETAISKAKGEEINFEKDIEEFESRLKSGEEKKPEFLRNRDEKSDVENFNIIAPGVDGLADVSHILEAKGAELSAKHLDLSLRDGGKEYPIEEIQKKLGFLNHYLEKGETPGGMPLNLYELVNEFPETGGIRNAVSQVIERHYPGFMGPEKVIKEKSIGEALEEEKEKIAAFKKDAGVPLEAPKEIPIEKPTPISVSVPGVTIFGDKPKVSDVKTEGEKEIKIPAPEVKVGEKIVDIVKDKPKEVLKTAAELAMERDEPLWYKKDEESAKTETPDNREEIRKKEIEERKKKIMDLDAKWKASGYVSGREEIPAEIEKLEKEIRNIETPPTEEKKEEKKEVKVPASWEELDSVIDSKGTVKGSSQEFTPEMLKDVIGKVRKGELDINAVTRSEGLRDSVKSLLDKEAKSAETPVSGKSEEKPVEAPVAAKVESSVEGTPLLFTERWNAAYVLGLMSKKDLEGMKGDKQEELLQKAKLDTNFSKREIKAAAELFSAEEKYQEEYRKLMSARKEKPDKSMKKLMEKNPEYEKSLGDWREKLKNMNVALEEETRKSLEKKYNGDTAKVEADLGNMKKGGIRRAIIEMNQSAYERKNSRESEVNAEFSERFPRLMKKLNKYKYLPKVFRGAGAALMFGAKGISAVLTFLAPRGFMSYKIENYLESRLVERVKDKKEEEMKAEGKDIVKDEYAEYRDFLTMKKFDSLAEKNIEMGEVLSEFFKKRKELLDRKLARRRFIAKMMGAGGGGPSYGVKTLVDMIAGGKK